MEEFREYNRKHRLLRPGEACQERVGTPIDARASSRQTAAIASDRALPMGRDAHSCPGPPRLILATHKAAEPLTSANKADLLPFYRFPSYIHWGAV